MAEAFARMHGSSRITVYSAGSRPSGAINPKAIAAMKAIGYDLTTHRSKSLADVPAGPYEYVITMGCGDECPFIAAHHRADWELPDPKHMDPEAFAAVRDDIEQRVLGLLKSLPD